MRARIEAVYLEANEQAVRLELSVGELCERELAPTLAFVSSAVPTQLVTAEHLGRLVDPGVVAPTNNLLEVAWRPVLPSSLLNPERTRVKHSSKVLHVHVSVRWVAQLWMKLRLGYHVYFWQVVAICSGVYENKTGVASLAGSAQQPHCQLCQAQGKVQATPSAAMGSGGVYAYRDLDEELFAPLADDCGYEIHQSPVKKHALCATRSESSLLQAHLAHRRALRDKFVVTLSFLVLLAVGTMALYHTLGASARALESSTKTLRGTRSPTEHVFEGEDSLILEDAARGAYRRIQPAEWDEDAEDEDPYDKSVEIGRVLEAE